MKKVSTIKDRMREALDVKGLRAVDIVERTGIPKGSISQYMLGKVEPKQNRLIPIANALGVNMYWLQGYDVPMGKDYIYSSEVIPNRINFYERVAAGDSKNNVIDTYMELIRILPRNPEEYFAVRVSGDSMLPTISDGDTVLVRRQNDVENGEIAVVNINGDDATIKRVYKSEQGITLVADNPSVYPPHFYSNEEIESLPVIIQGKATTRIGDLK